MRGIDDRVGAVVPGQCLPGGVGFADDDAALEADDLAEVLQEQQAGRAGAGDDDRLHARRWVAVLQAIAGDVAAATHRGMRVEDAGQGFGEGGVFGGQRVPAPHRIDGRHDEDLRQPALPAGDAVLGIRLALVRVARRAVLAQRAGAGAEAVAALVEDHRVAGRQVAHLAARGLDDARHFVPEHLRRDVERDGLTETVGVVVGVAFVDVEVGAAEADAGHPHDDVARSDDRVGDVADRHHAGSGEDGRLQETLDER